MSVPDDFIKGDGPHLVEASAGTGKTYWMVQAAVRLMLHDAGVPKVKNTERLLAVTFTRAATAELKERLRAVLHGLQRIADGGLPRDDEQWMSKMLDGGGAEMRERLDQTLASLDRLAITTIHGFCKGVLEEFALECGVPVGLRFIEDDSEYLEAAAADEWRALTWEAGSVSRLVMAERMGGDAKDWSPTELKRAAKVVRQGVGAVLPPRIERESLWVPVEESLAAVVAHWDADRLSTIPTSVVWKQDEGLTPADFEHLRVAIKELQAGRAANVADITRWARSNMEKMSNKKSKTNKPLLAAEPFLDPCELVLQAVNSAASRLWQDAVLSVAERTTLAMKQDRVAGFDDMISLLQQAITDASTGARLREILAGRYDAVLVDEFQDTDWAQWSIFSSTFGIKPLVLVGDPKQSIYGFRGADIVAYREARAMAEPRIFTQDTNYRTDDALVRATELLFSKSDTPFGVPRSVLDFGKVKARRPESTLQDPDRRSMVLVDLGTDNVDRQERRTAKFIAAEVARLLRDPQVRYLGDKKKGPRALQPSDIAILVSAHKQATPLLKELRALGIPAVTGATGDITESTTWADVMAVIAAIDDPSDPRSVRRALATAIAGLSARELAAIEQDAAGWRRRVERLAEARRDWTSRGVLAALIGLANDWDARRNMAAYPDGERRLTDLRHMIALMQNAERDGHRNPTLLRAWARSFAEASGTERETRQLHLESDADAVIISTVHAAKGLEYPVVFCGYLWKGSSDRDSVPRVAQFAGGARRVVFSENPMPDEIPGDSALSESLRLAYVALTRAKSRTYVVWAKGKTAKKAAIHHLLDALGDSATAALAEETPELITRLGEDEIAAIPHFPAVDAAAGAAISVEARDVQVAAAQSRSWTVSSYSQFTKGLAGFVELVEAGPVDEAEASTPDVVTADQLPSGAHTGNALHKLFEKFDFTAVDDGTTRDTAIVDVLSDYGLPRLDADPAQLAAAVDLVRRMMIATLGTPIPGATSPLSSVTGQRTLREWGFNMPMQGVSAPRLAEAFRAHGASWIGESYAPLLERASRREIHGILTGNVDLVAEIDGRWWIVDWKSNSLGATASSYDDASCRREMVHSHYVTQYHIYVVALHRFLRSRLRARYDYERDFGGVGYAFLRGLALGTPSWFTDRPSLALVDALDACIGGTSDE